MSRRFETDLLDIEDPFEIDRDNRPHLYKHLPVAGGRYVAVGEVDLYDLYVTDSPLFYPAREDGPADWLMVGQIPAMLLVVPLAPPRSGRTDMCRPIGIYSPPRDLRESYLRDSA